MMDMPYTTQFDIRSKKKVRGWLIVGSTLKPDRFVFYNNMMMIEFDGYVVYVQQDKITSILRFPWAKEDIVMIKLEWLLDGDKKNGIVGVKGTHYC